MLDGIKGLLRDAVCAALGLHTTEQLRLSTQMVHDEMAREVGRRDLRIAALERQVGRAAAPERLSEAVDAIACPQCGAHVSQPCRHQDGRPCRRTHKARMEAWRAMQAEDAAEGAGAQAVE